MLIFMPCNVFNHVPYRNWACLGSTSCGPLFWYYPTQSFEVSKVTRFDVA